MAELLIPEELAERLRDIARRENRSVADVLQSWLERYAPPLPSPGDETKKQEAIRRVRLKTYERARRYWRQVGDSERLALTDEQLDEQFWLIDHHGIPRLKSEQGTIELPPDPLMMMAEAAEKAGLSSDYTDLSERADEYMRSSWPEYLAHKWRRNDDEQGSD
jgi:hypothetical protein